MSFGKQQLVKYFLMIVLLYTQFDAGSQKLLDNAERYALYLAEALDDDDRRRRVWQTNNMGEIP